MYRWAESTTIKFVEEYLKHDCLWDSRHMPFKNPRTKEARQAAYADIRKAMNIDGFGHNEILQKIKNIRSTYSQELKKIKESKISGDYVYVPNIKWFYLLDTKLKSIAPGNTPELPAPDLTNILYTYEPHDTTFHDQSQTINEDTSSHNDYSMSSSSKIPRTKKKLDKRGIHDSWAKLETNIHNDYNASTSYQTSLKKRKIKSMSSIVQEIKELKEGIIRNNGDENEFDIFGRLITAQLKALPLPLAIEAQQHIQSYINEFRLSHFKEKNDQST